MSALAQVPTPINWKSAIGIAVAGMLGLGVYWAATSPRLRTNRRRPLRRSRGRVKQHKAYLHGYQVGRGKEPGGFYAGTLTSRYLKGVRAGRHSMRVNAPAWIQTVRAWYVVGPGPEYLIKEVAAGGSPPANMASGPHRTWHGAQTAHKRLSVEWWRRPVASGPYRNGLTQNSLRRDMDELVRKARGQGWTVEKTKGNHWKFQAPSGQVIFTSSTPSDWRAIKNAMSFLKRHGLRENSAAQKRSLAAKRRSEGFLVEAARLESEALRSERRSRGRPKKMSELGVYDAIGIIRSEKPRGQLGFMPPALVSQLRRSPRGLYKYGLGSKKGWTLTRFKTASLRGAMTSTRIASTSSGEMHWLIDNEDPRYPVLVRLVDKTGHSAYRVEDFAKRFERVPVMVERRRASSR